MRLFSCAVLVVCAGLLGGCATQGEGRTARSAKPIVTLDTALVGKVARINASGAFVVLSFPLGKMPGPDRTFGVYRDGRKVGELKTGTRQLDDMIVADIVSGECQVGDEVSDR